MKKLIELLTNQNVVTYKKGVTIAFEDSLCTKVRLVKSGHIRISSITSNGQEIVYKNLFDGDLFGNNLIFSNNPYYRGDVIAVEQSEVIEFNSEEFLNLLTNNKEFLKGFLHYQSEDSKKLNQTIKVLSIPTSDEKLFYLLQINHGELKIKSITDLSRKLNITREATSRMVNRLIKDNKIELIENVIKCKNSINA